ncbi:hypothetical protein BC6307_21385 [Sutcliffiella cohnii]|uniref:Glycosyl transferase family 28 C-terminal domain-containing protein n=1 Tax=Sutcliffiella cohnii TaxID=33932 RepID=A0A223KW93_9BACI|nr:PssE/Cps14G family polysaccharide biosynthesis glycosyltransferase [Sutcliffiella cohnii]AST93634.1 hypothetical protein BC6307_21385 [Sutcliffiella cohnii]
MIFVCLGTQIFQFNRLLSTLDSLIEGKLIDEPVYAQIGHSTYTPKNFEYSKFLEPDIFQDYICEARIVITHGGTGAIVKALKANKQIIAVPRREKYEEHSDDHQLQIVNFFTENGYVKRVDEVNELLGVIKSFEESPITKKFKGEGRIVEIISDFINSQD